MFPLNILFKRLIRTGTLRVVDAAGREQVFGDGTGDPVTLRLNSRLVPWKISLRPAVAAGEAYMDGEV
ncbi:MAG: SAM-dependent methyltransferase, partial [Alphaproteobacteria bacterium]|nr:SAM-dependent methyltransferase [Alphaproteobacteria bacterium]